MAGCDVRLAQVVEHEYHLRAEFGELRHLRDLVVPHAQVDGQPELAGQSDRVHERGLQSKSFGFVLNELTYPRHPRLVTESFKGGADCGCAAVEGHTGHQRLDSPIAPAKVLDPRGLLVHHVPHGVGLDEDQGFDLDVAHLEVRRDEGAVQLAEALEPRVVESIGVPEVDVAVHHGLCRCHESHSGARPTRSSTECVPMSVSSGAHGPALTGSAGPLGWSFSRRPKRAPMRKAYCQADVKSAALSFVTSVVPVSMAFT